MPTYSYRCTECGTAFDIHQAFTDDSLTECPSCSGRLRKLFSAVGVTFNGSGFYRTDSRSGGSDGAAATGGDSAKGGSDGPSAKKSDSGAAAAPSSTPSSTSTSTSSS